VLGIVLLLPWRRFCASPLGLSVELGRSVAPPNNSRLKLEVNFTSNPQPTRRRRIAPSTLSHSLNFPPTRLPPRAVSIFAACFHFDSSCGLIDVLRVACCLLCLPHASRAKPSRYILDKYTISLEWRPERFSSLRQASCLEELRWLTFLMPSTHQIVACLR
jgi:hypothetical protein